MSNKENVAKELEHEFIMSAIVEGLLADSVQKSQAMVSALKYYSNNVIDINDVYEIMLYYDAKNSAVQKYKAEVISV